MKKSNDQHPSQDQQNRQKAFDDQRRSRMQEGDKNQRKTADTNRNDSNNTLQPQNKPLKY